MERLKAIEAAMEIIRAAQLATVGNNPGAWDFLYSVRQHLEAQSVEAFSAEFREVQS